MSQKMNGNSTNSAQARNKELAIKTIKNLPVWQYEETFYVELLNLKHDLDNLLQAIDKTTETFQNLPQLDRLKQPLPPAASSDDCTNVKIFRKDGGKYIEQKEPENKGPERPLEERDPLRDESVRRLEHKVQANEEVFAMLKPKEPWVRCRVYQVFCRPNRGALKQPNITFRLKRMTENGERMFDANKYSVARIQYHGHSLRPTKRVIAGSTEKSLLPGIIGSEASTQTKNRYLVHMDDGSAAYFTPDQVFPILGQSAKPWQDSRFLNQRADFNESRMRLYFSQWPRRYVMQEIAAGAVISLLKCEELVDATLLSFDEDVMRVRYSDGSEESIYRGSPRLLAKNEAIQRQLRNVSSLDQYHTKIKLSLFLYKRAGEIALNEDFYHCADSHSKRFIVSRNHNTARKSTATIKKRKLKVQLDGQLVEENPTKIKKYDELKFARSREHKCSKSCLEVPGIKTEVSVKDLIREYMDVSALKVPLLLGWKRALQYVPAPRSGETKIVVVYEAPCGKIFKEAHLLSRYLNNLESKLDIDYFTFDREIQLNRKVGEFEAMYHVQNIAVDKKTGEPLETKNISLLNIFTQDRLPIDFEYCSERFPHPMLKAKGFSFNNEFKSSCDCDDQCISRANDCSCHINNALFYLKDNPAAYKVSSEANCQYRNKRLLKQVATGIFECNSSCSCSSKCGNRVVQNGIKFRLQVYKTLGKGWGVVTLDDIPQGAFICTYSAELLDDADQYGDSDMYYADLDYITVNEAQKLGSDEDDDEPRVYDDLPFVRLHEYLNSHDFTLDARMQGNVGRFFNHSCDPNAFVQNVFIETHDLRFPVVAFFASRLIKACDEITWNYNYKMGSIAGRRIECRCGASNCRGRIL